MGSSDRFGRIGFHHLARQRPPLGRLFGGYPVARGRHRSVSGFLARTRGVENRWRYLPLTSPLAVLWGILLLAKPDVWIELFMIVLGVVMLLMAVMQLVSLGQMRKAGIPVTGGYFVFPVLLLLAGIVVFFNPFATTVWLTVFFGAWVLAYGVVEMFDYFSLHKAVPAASKKIDAPKEND